MPGKQLLSQRTAGVLLHPTSLPGRHGCGDMGLWAYRFVDFLSQARQHWWQMLPIGPIGPGNAPYSSPSAFAGNPLLICLDRLVEDDLLEPDDVPALPTAREVRVAYASVIRYRMQRLAKAFTTFTHAATARQQTALARFCERHDEWLDDYALYETLKQLHGGRAWTDWPRPLALRQKRALAQVRKDHAERIAQVKFIQYVFDRQWDELKTYCEQNGVALFGDIPIFVNHDSADVWAHRKLFRLDQCGRPTVVSGCPPDFLNKNGQLWGHPLYDWKQHQRSGFAWWIARFRETARRFHAMRVDHFLGFHRCWTIPARARTARRGTWTPSPGAALLSAVRKALRGLEIVAEDLGAVTPEAIALRDRFGLPGMRILQNAFGDGARYDQPHNWPRACVGYTGTHDTPTTVQWFQALPRRGDRHRGRDGLLERERVLRYLGTDGIQIQWELIRLLYSSVANTVIVPMQDLLGLDRHGRMNIPGTPHGNWQWRARSTAFTATLSDRLADLVDTYERDRTGD